ncbi:MAG: sulfatase [bacterium]|nr:sulfatase [bacterium]
MTARYKIISPKLPTPLIFSIFIILLLFSSCRPDRNDASENHPSALSLLTVTPFVGTETALRDPLPETTRYSLDNESVEGWLSPPEKILRFPINISRDAHLHIRLRLVIDKSSLIGNLTARVEFNRLESSGDNAPDILFETRPDQITGLVQNWTPVDIDLSDYAISTGEFRFIADGSLAGNPDVHLLWGEPAIYYPDENRHHNILLIGVDTLRQDICSPYGADPEITPNLSSLAENASVFTKVWSQSPWTFPSFSSMITGNYPSTIGAIGYNERIPDSATTIGEILRAEGYATHTSCGNPWIGNENSGFDQGMDSLWYKQNAIAAEAVSNTEEFISRSGDRDWFCFLHLQDPHSDYAPPPEFAGKFRDPNYSGRYPLAFRDLDTWRLEGYQFDPTEVDQIKNLYTGEVAYVDYCLGELFNWMASNGVMEDTLIIFTADHGEEFLEHGHFGHGQNQFDVLVRTPLIIKGPDFTEDTKIDTPVSNMDIVPTILRYLNLPAAENLPGTPLQDYINNDANPPRIIFGEECYDDATKFAVDWPYKCILDFMTGATTLYDLENDPGELTDISLSHPDITERLTNDMRTTLISRRPYFIVLIVGHPDENPMHFTGNITLPGGIDSVRDYSLNESDILTLNENSIDFDIVNSLHGTKTLKILVIFPTRGSYDLSGSVRIDGDAPNDRFFPYGTSDPDPTGDISVYMGDFPWPAQIPSDFRNQKSACYILAIPGLDPDENAESSDYGLDPEAIEQLRAIGYLK